MDCLWAQGAVPLHLLKLELMALKLRTVTLYRKCLLRLAVRTQLLGLELVGE